MMYVFYVLILFSVVLLWFKIKRRGLNLIRFNFAIYLIISLIPFTILYTDYFLDIKSYFVYKLYFTLVFLLLIHLDNSKIQIKSHSKMDLSLVHGIAFFSLFIIVLFVLSIGINKFPLFNVLSGSYKELILMREDSYKNANIPQILFYLIFYVKYFFIPLYASAVIIYWKYLNHKFTVLILLIMVVNQLLTLSKTALFLMILSAILTKLYLTKITLSKIFFSITALTLVPLSILYVIASDRELLVTLGALGNRIFLIPEDSALYYFNLYLNGTFESYTSSNLFAIYNQKQTINIQNFVFLEMNPNALLQQGTAPGNIFGIAYVDFNEYLIPLYHLFILGTLFWLNSLIVKYNHYFVISLLVTASMGFSFIYFTNFPTVMNSYGIIFIVIITLILRSKQINNLRRMKI